MIGRKVLLIHKKYKILIDSKMLFLPGFNMIFQIDTDSNILITF